MSKRILSFYNIARLIFFGHLKTNVNILNDGYTCQSKLTPTIRFPNTMEVQKKETMLCKLVEAISKRLEGEKNFSSM